MSRLVDSALRGRGLIWLAGGTESEKHHEKATIVLVGAIAVALLFACADQAENFESAALEEPIEVEEVIIDIEHVPSPDWDIASESLAAVMTEEGFFRGHRSGFVASSSFEGFDDNLQFARINLGEYADSVTARGRLQERKDGLPEEGMEIFSEGLAEGFAFRGYLENAAVHEIGITFDKYTLHAIVSERDFNNYLSPLIDRLNYKDMTVIPDDPLQEFHEAMIGLNRFGQDTGNVRGMVGPVTIYALD